MRTAFNLAEQSGFLRLLQHSRRNETNSLYVLNYHRVDEVNHRPWLNPGLISTTPGEFEKQIRLVASYYQPVTVQEVLRAACGEVTLPSQAVLVTVDDGYLDFKEVIFPTAQRYGIFPVLFVATAFVGQGNFWWDQLYRIIYQSKIKEINTPLGLFSVRSEDEKKRTFQRLSQLIKSTPFEKAMDYLNQWLATAVNIENEKRATLNWDELRNLSHLGAVIASHTHNHPILSQVSPEQARKEIRNSQHLIQKEIGNSYPIFAYPNGPLDSFNPAVEKILIEEGFKMAFTTQEGFARIGKDDHYQLRRIGIWSKTTLSIFHYHLTPFYRR